MMNLFLILTNARSFLSKSVNSPNKIRCISMSHTLNKTTPKNTKSASSHEWLTRQLNDQYCIRSRYDHYRCRSAYKLLEIDEKYRILKPGFSVVDCGAAPGSWTQVVVKKLKLDEETPDDSKFKGIVVSVDLQDIQKIKGAVIIKESDFTDPSVQDIIWSYLPNKKADVVLSDMAPKASGIQSLDSNAIMNMVYIALRFSVLTLKKDGTFLCKVWDNDGLGKFISTMEKLFTTVKRVKPKASRTDSAELFILAKGFKSEQFVK